MQVIQLIESCGGEIQDVCSDDTTDLIICADPSDSELEVVRDANVLFATRKCQLCGVQLLDTGT